MSGKMFRSFVAPALAILCVMLTGGCISTGAGYGFTLAPDDKEKALVLVGIRNDADHMGEPAVALNFAPVDENSKAQYLQMRNYTSLKDIREKKRTFLSSEIYPGQYFIQYFVFGIPGQTSTTFVCSEVTIVFNIEAGKVNYLGDFTLLYNKRKTYLQNATLDKDAKVLSAATFNGFSLNYDEPSARVELANYGKVTAPMVRVAARSALAELRTEKAGSSDEKQQNCILRQ
ncbi:hypothetical protein [Niveispirillum sp.]|uniref:hypothetical protein n=1 Tax=Niveispirillum sp. TaxID=1917217 RepID=UPI001B49F1FA|nr:hypothetical protein [Niveispirillum sp.]MBP7336516.1 hypothetical protein [Niveispirillum sp.]